MTRHQHDESFKLIYGSLPVIQDHVAAFHPNLSRPHGIERLPGEWIQDYTPHELKKTVSDLAVLLQDATGSPYACLVIEYQAHKMDMTARMASYMAEVTRYLRYHGRHTATGSPIPVVPAVIFVASVRADYPWYTFQRAGEELYYGEVGRTVDIQDETLDLGQAAWQHNLAVCWLALKQLQHQFTNPTGQDIRDLEHLLLVRLRPQLTPIRDAWQWAYLRGLWQELQKVHDQFQGDFPELVFWQHTEAIMQTLKDTYRVGLQEGEQKGRQEGLREGEQKGRQEGLQEGEQKGHMGALMEIARALWGPGQEAVLEQWLDTPNPDMPCTVQALVDLYRHNLTPQDIAADNFAGPEESAPYTANRRH